MKSIELKQVRNQKLVSMGELIDSKNAESREFTETEKDEHSPIVRTDFL